MSVALEFAPAVTIPERARPRPVGLPAGSPDGGRRLATVTQLCPPVDAPGGAPLRLTRRGVLVLALAVAALGAGLVWLASLSAPHAAAAPPPPRAVTVQSGDTLWSIATRVAPQGDPVAEVAALQRRNHLTSAELVPGQVLQIP